MKKCMSMVFMIVFLFSSIDTASAVVRSKSQVLSYISGLQQKPIEKVLSGQLIGSIGWPDVGLFDQVAAISGGKYPAIMSSDWGFWGYQGGYDYSRIVPDLLSHWNNGGLIETCWHVNNPVTNAWNWDDTTPVNLADVYTPGNPTYNVFKSHMDAVAAGLKMLQDSGAVVLFRPFHEMNGNWFWWGDKDPAQYINLWRYVHDYMTNTKGLTNLIWVYCVNRDMGDELAYYPGSQYVDIVGIDYYDASGHIYTPPEYANLLTLGKPFAMTEVGQCAPGTTQGCTAKDSRFIIEDIRNNLPKTLYFNVWNDVWALTNMNNVTELLADPWVITRDEVAVGGTNAIKPSPPMRIFIR
jgi:mannan endo-1,4-beta-mannosidase